jgi:hypothetical protein
MDPDAGSDRPVPGTAIVPFDDIINFWINSLGSYRVDALFACPAPGNWSIGQLYLHLINDTRFFIEQVNACLSHNDNLEAQPIPAAKIMLDNNEFPDLLIEGHPDNAKIPQPTGKPQLKRIADH